jgi:hypothetical protein
VCKNNFVRMSESTNFVCEKMQEREKATRTNQFVMTASRDSGGKNRRPLNHTLRLLTSHSELTPQSSLVNEPNPKMAAGNLKSEIKVNGDQSTVKETMVDKPNHHRINAGVKR